MNINVSIIDQRVAGIINNNYELFQQNANEEKNRSSAFVLLCMSTALELGLEESAELFTDGGNDAGIDGIQIGEEDDGEFPVTLFQGKYKMKDLSGESNFPENGVKAAINTVATIFDPSRPLQLNDRIKPIVEDIRSLVRDGYIPNVKFILCNNGTKWNAAAQGWIDAAKKDYGNKVEFCHFNHDNIVNILQRTKRVDAQLVLTGKAIIEDMNYLRVLIGRVSVREIARLFNEHGEKFLERNIRRYLGMTNNRVNLAIHETLKDISRADKFYFFNNGITVVCDKFDYNAFQKEDYQVQIRNMQIINGGQTCKTIQETLNGLTSQQTPDSAYVMIRVYQLSESSKDFVKDITYATNSQNPVDLRDLRSNDDIQKKLEIGIHDLGYTYKRQREEGTAYSTIISSSSVAESVLAIWRFNPQQAKFRRKEHFGVLYNDIFGRLNPAQAILAVMIFRFVENQRKKAVPDQDPDFIPYASHYIAMLIGVVLIHRLGLKNADEITHRNFKDIFMTFEQLQIEFYNGAKMAIIVALTNLYGKRDISLQQLSATFRRGDLLEYLNTTH